MKKTITVTRKAKPTVTLRKSSGPKVPPSKSGYRKYT